MIRHGTYVAYVQGGCRCDACRAAKCEYERRRTRRRIFEATTPGAVTAYVDGDLVRDHVRSLMAQGMGWKRVAQAAGLSCSTVYPILYGKYLDSPGHPEHRPPRVKVSRRVADALLAVELDLADGALVDGNGTRLRLRALVSLGWSRSRLAEMLNIAPANATPLFEGRRVTRATRDRVAALYEQLWDTPPATTRRGEERGITMAQREAARRRWPMPMDLDDDRIDDPTYRPRRLREIA